MKFKEFLEEVWEGLMEFSNLFGFMLFLIVLGLLAKACNWAWS